MVQGVLVLLAKVFKPLPNQVQEMWDELSQLTARIKALSSQISDTTLFYSKPFHERSLMEEQLRSMEWYKTALRKRIKHHKDS